MFYRPGTKDHGLPYNPFKAIVAPRPIAWISTIDSEGRANLAPYSFFNAFSDVPPMVAYGSGKSKLDIDEGKDTLANIRASEEFVINLVSFDLRDAMNVSSQHFPAGTDEFERAGLTKSPCETVKAPRVGEAPASLECKLWKILELPGGESFMVIGEVTGIHVDPAMIRDGRYDVTLVKPLARLGYRDYSVTEDLISLARPDD